MKEACPKGARPDRLDLEKKVRRVFEGKLCVFNVHSALPSNPAKINPWNHTTVLGREYGIEVKSTSSGTRCLDHILALSLISYVTLDKLLNLLSLHL